MKDAVMTIAGSDSGAGAGIQADLKTIMMHNLWGVSVITAITAQNTFKISKIYKLPLNIIEEQFDVLIEDYNIKAIKTGMLVSKDIVELISNKIKKLKIPLVIDPVLRSTTGTELIENDFIDALKENLIPKAEIITPNINEAEKLTGIIIKTNDDLEEALKILKKLGSNSVLIKGGHLFLDNKYVTDTLFYKNKFYKYKKVRIKGKFHGLGCTLSSSIACNLAKEYDIVESIERSENFISKVLQNSTPVAKGLIPVNQKIE